MSCNDTAAPDLVTETILSRDRAYRLKMEMRFIIWRGHARLDVREHRFSGGAWHATEKGVSIKLRELDDVIEALTALRDRLAAR